MVKSLLEDNMNNEREEIELCEQIKAYQVSLIEARDKGNLLEMFRLSFQQGKLEEKLEILRDESRGRWRR